MSVPLNDPALEYSVAVDTIQDRIIHDTDQVIASHKPDDLGSVWCSNIFEACTTNKQQQRQMYHASFIQSLAGCRIGCTA